MKHLTPSKTLTLSKASIVGDDLKIATTPENEHIYTSHASSGVFKGATLKVYRGKKGDGVVAASTKLDKAWSFPIEFPELGREVRVQKEGAKGSYSFRFAVGGREVEWRHTAPGEVVVVAGGNDGLSAGGTEEKSQPWNWKLVPVSSGTGGSDEVLAMFHQDATSGWSGAARLFWFDGGMGMEGELMALVVVLTMEERAKKTQMMAVTGDVNSLSGKAQVWGSGW